LLADRVGRPLVLWVAGVLDDISSREAQLVEALQRAVQRLTP
jgi:hypothetical protein